MDIRKAWPLHDNVQDGPRAFGRWMTAARDVDIDDPYWRARLGDGSISLTDPTPASPAAEPTTTAAMDASAPAVFVAAINAGPPLTAAHTAEEK